jgi:hypothetical protein
MTAPRPWKALRTPPPFRAPEATSQTKLKEAPLPSYEVDLSGLFEVEEATRVIPGPRRSEPPVSRAPVKEKSAWDSRAMLALELSKLGAFSKADADTVIAQAERLGIAFTKSRSHVVVFDGQNFTLAPNTVTTRAFFKLDSFLRRLGGGR